MIFTGSGTEALNLAIKGSAWAGYGKGRHIVLTGVEHPAVDRSVAFLERQGFEATRVGVDEQGFLDPAELEAAIRPETFLVCVHHAQADLGSVQDLASICRVVEPSGALLLVDATASGGWVPVDVSELPIDLLALSPHRFGGPKGVGVLYRHRRARLESLVHGGNQEYGLRGGTENVLGIVGAGRAAEVALRDWEVWVKHVRGLRHSLWGRLTEEIPLLRLNGPALGERRLPHHLNVSVEFVEGEGLVLALDFQGVSIHSGPACMTGSNKIAPALKAAGLSSGLAKGSVMMSTGIETTLGDVEEAVGRIAKVVLKLRGMSPMWEAYCEGRVGSEMGDGRSDIGDRRWDIG
jgi:cysteine desulfurase